MKNLKPTEKDQETERLADQLLPGAPLQPPPLPSPPSPPPMQGIEVPRMADEKTEEKAPEPVAAEAVLAPLPPPAAPLALRDEAQASAIAIAEQSRAMVEARTLMALKRPRHIDSVRQVMLKECQRPSLARVARYQKPIGGRSVSGPSIRFAEMALRAMGNIYQESSTLYDGPDRRVVRVLVADLESNTSFSRDVTLAKTVERKQLRPGQQSLGQRTNTKGETVYLVEATEEDLLTKEAAALSKLIRTNGLRLVPGDLVEEAMDQVGKTLRDAAAKDPDAERKAVCDAFAEFGVAPPALEAFVGAPLAQFTPAMLATLREIWTALKEGETTWAEVAKAAPEKNGGQSQADRIKAKLGGEQKP